MSVKKTYEIVAVDNPDPEMLVIAEKGLTQDQRREILEEALPQVREKTAQAIEKIESGQIQEAAALCEEILAQQPDFDQISYALAYLLYYLQGKKNLKKADQILKRLKKVDPKNQDVWILAGKVYFAQKRYLEARDAFRKVMPLEIYEPFVYQEYGLALLYLKQPQEGLAMLRMDLQEFQKTGDIPNDMMLDGSFQQVLLLEISIAEKYFAEDLGLYEQFLLQADMSDPDLQGMVGTTVVLMSEQLHRQWLRKPFKEFVTFLDEHKLLNGIAQMAIITAYTSVESYEMHDDERVSSFVMDYVSNVRDMYNLEKQIELAGEESLKDKKTDLYLTEEERYMQELSGLTYEWYMARYYKDHADELEYVKQQYPHSWEYIARCVEQADADPSYPDQLIDRIAENAQKAGMGAPKEDIRKELERIYPQAINTQKEPWEEGGLPDHEGMDKSGALPCA